MSISGAGLARMAQIQGQSYRRRPIDEELDRAMREGKEFEERVLEKYRSQGEEVIVE